MLLMAARSDSVHLNGTQIEEYETCMWCDQGSLPGAERADFFSLVSLLKMISNTEGAVGNEARSSAQRGPSVLESQTEQTN